ncbi:nucleotide-binding protein [Flavobacteriaceae bacterium]|jgi:predicted nucleotide-binding protein|nr:nucleotide-binding protein [Flavobacteriaceae bacterium]
MYYQVLIETKEKVGKSQNNRQYFELDKTDLQEIKEDIVIPYLQKNEFQFDGYFLNPKDIARVIIKESQNTSKECSRHANDSLSPGIIMYISPEDIVEDDKYTKDITKDVFADSKTKIKAGHNSKPATKTTELDKSKVFIVHGHDDLAKEEVARFIEKLKLSAIILHEQASSGKTIIEKIEEYSNVGFGIVLYTPCDIGSTKDDKENLQFRARQNVVFEHGYLMGKIGRNKVCALVKDKVETPNDISGVVYVTMDYHKAC